MHKFEKELDQKFNEIIKKAQSTGALDGFEFSIAMQSLFISYPIIASGNWENVNAALLLHLVEKCKKHPVARNKLRY